MSEEIKKKKKRVRTEENLGAKATEQYDQYDEYDQVYDEQMPEELEMLDEFQTYDGMDGEENFDAAEAPKKTKKKTKSNGAVKAVKTSDGDASSRNGKRKQKKKKKMMKNVVLFAIEAVVLLGLAVALYLVITGTGNVQKINVDGDEELGIESVVSDEVNDVFTSTMITNEKGEQKSLAESYKQVALFGVDSREGELAKSTRTDTIIIASINLETNDVKLCSVYRDTYLNLTTDSYNKCNSAYAKGGPRQAINMLNTNLDLNIDDFITVGFKGVVETVNALGGVTMDITDAEIGYLNDYQYCIAEDLDIPTYTKVQNVGTQTLNGLQACAYCRIRYTAGDDFKRAERQRNVVEQMIVKAKTADPATLNSVATSAFKNVATSFDLDEILKYAANAPFYNVVGSAGFPFEDKRVCATVGNKGSCVIPTNLADNVSMLHEFLFGVQGYVPTNIVKECSDEIDKQTAPYL